VYGAILVVLPSRGCVRTDAGEVGTGRFEKKGPIVDLKKRTAVKTKKSGLTVIEILVVVGIIALLIGLLLPAVHTVQKMAKNTKEKAQLTAIGLGLAAFKNDYGDYPPSSWNDPAVAGTPTDYCGAQKLAEALLGWDLLGFHPDSAWRADGLDAAGGPMTYDPLHTDPTEAGLKKRRDRYIELDMANVFRLGRSTWGDGLYLNTGQLAPHAYVLCDVFGGSERKIIQDNGKTVSPGMPILYYKANPASKLFPNPTTAVVEPLEAYVYNARDNWPLLSLGRVGGSGRPLDKHPLEGDAARPMVATVDGVVQSFTGWSPFYWYIHDPRMRPRYWPYRPDSYLLISAGADGLYGTEDDICNFGQ
jgi:type II secretory pathway pseudopilin PulG